jgi:hypothetical protein
MLTSKLLTLQDNVQRKWDPHFEWVIHETAPWSVLARPLAASTVALVSTCGLYRVDTQLPFDAWHDLGDASFREVHVDTPPERLRIAHSHYDHRHVASDPYATVPIPHLRGLVAEGVIGRLHPWTYSFMGYLPQTRQLVNESAPAVARRLQDEGVDAALLTPC